jgi:hypothetical protein
MKEGPMGGAVVLVLALSSFAWAGKTEAPALVAEHTHSSGAFSFKTPAGWSVGPPKANPDALDASGDGVVVRFLYRPDEIGFDALHALCMLERLAAPMAQNPRVEYEYDFISATVGDRRSLDSAFLVRYDAAIAGYREWRQRNLTLVGAGESLCLITYAPQPLWKQRATRRLLEAVLASVAFKTSLPR